VVLVNSDNSRLRYYSNFRYQMFGIIESDALLDFNKSVEHVHVPFKEICYIGSLESIPINFKQLMQDLFDETKNLTYYDPNATHSFDKTPQHVFYTKRIFSANVGRVFFYFEKAFGNLKWIRFDNSNILMQVKDGMVRKTFTDEDFAVTCTPTPHSESLFSGI